MERRHKPSLNDRVDATLETASYESMLHGLMGDSEAGTTLWNCFRTHIKLIQTLCRFSQYLGLLFTVSFFFHSILFGLLNTERSMKTLITKRN